MNILPRSQKTDKWQYSHFAPDQNNTINHQCFVRAGDVNCSAWFRCFSAPFDIMRKETPAWRCIYKASQKQRLLLSPFSPSQCFGSSSMPKYQTYLYSGTAFAWKSLYNGQLSGLLFITNLTGEDQQFQSLLQGSLRACLPDFNGYVWSMVYGGWTAWLPLTLIESGG